MLKFPLTEDAFRKRCRDTLEAEGALVLKNLVYPEAINRVQREGYENQHKAFYTKADHNIYLTTSDESYDSNHPRNRLISSSKGCITDDQIPQESLLHTLYDSSIFRDFLCAVLDTPKLYEYADPLSSINLHYASEGQELGWHFDNSSFAITLMIQKPTAGGKFEYVKNVRDADAGEMNYGLAQQVLDGEIEPNVLEMSPGTLVLFRGRNSLHRVTPTQGNQTRMLVVFAYNTEPDVSLSESARMTFYGRLN
ncbi:2OG-Fe(II) oxygenase [Marinomonas sp. C2222]|uniref:2OG-Fe(II) oxygenase n=1 Tax=Marinomonas sargassi TaxID=2984494 RepID=A0ABT2YS12_9GAMM|nr:2OG-Fe(II) oxygenase [Marinomonas sargassi]MCV2402545.1 2OG-Fe(II) oxygenase [Marinomonas sargassi]